MMASKNNKIKSHSIPRSNNKTSKKEPEAKSPSEPANRSQALTIVGIRASAGDLSALRSFFEVVAPNAGMAFKDELLSVNEALRTANNDMKNKLEELSYAHQEPKNLIGASEIGTLFLDREMRIQHVTAGVNHIISSKKTTVQDMATGGLMRLHDRLNLMGCNLRVLSQPGKGIQVTLEIQPDRGYV